MRNVVYAALGLVNLAAWVTVPVVMLVRAYGWPSPWFYLLAALVVAVVLFVLFVDLDEEENP